MDKSEVRAILSAYRPGDPETADPRFQQAKLQAEADPELAQWWAEQQEVDQLIAVKLQSASVPPGLKARVTAWEKRSSQRLTWNRTTMLAAASIVALALLFGAWRISSKPTVTLADYRDEMVSFVKQTPALDLKSEDLTRITEFLEKSGTPTRANLPVKLGELDPIGCRTLRFRGHNVALVCFKRTDGRLVHLFVVDRAALPRMARDGGRDYSGQGEWMTAAWAEGDQAYLLAVQGDRETLEKYLSNS